ncbi:Cob(I)alamin adenosyltransferase [hydrothermal vent metagenome]|uniref:Cob(I)alamin adenosyltransferase n=1 Tax=hydrothermal vent metagenome TaxID=652676 RepID=A0A3B1BIS7_9ZZZZ
MEEAKGITVIFTGDGKGKTSAALGVVARSLGHGKKCKIIQFIKGRRRSGEHYLAERLAPDLEIVMSGKGFTWLADVSREDHETQAQEGLKLAEEAITSGRYAVVALDEILYALRSGLVKIEQVEKLIDLRPEGSHLVLTGRDAPQRLIDKADLVTNMQVIKHPKQAGIPAQKCMDY